MFWNLFGKLSGPGKSWKWSWSWKVLEFDRQFCRWKFWLQKDMFLLTKMTIIVTTSYVFWAPPETPLGELTLLSQTPSCCSSRYLYIAGLRQVPQKCFWGPGKVLKFFVTKRMWTLIDLLLILSMLTSVCRHCRSWCKNAGRRAQPVDWRLSASRRHLPSCCLTLALSQPLHDDVLFIRLSCRQRDKLSPGMRSPHFLWYSDSRV